MSTRRERRKDQSLDVWKRIIESKRKRRGIFQDHGDSFQGSSSKARYLCIVVLLPPLSPFRWVSRATSPNSGVPCFIVVLASPQSPILYRAPIETSPMEGACHELFISVLHLGMCCPFFLLRFPTRPRRSSSVVVSILHALQENKGMGTKSPFSLGPCRSRGAKLCQLWYWHLPLLIACEQELAES